MKKNVFFRAFYRYTWSFNLLLCSNSSENKHIITKFVFIFFFLSNISSYTDFLNPWFKKIHLLVETFISFQTIIPMRYVSKETTHTYIINMNTDLTLKEVPLESIAKNKLLRVAKCFFPHENNLCIPLISLMHLRFRHGKQLLFPSFISTLQKGKKETFKS